MACKCLEQFGRLPRRSQEHRTALPDFNKVVSYIVALGGVVVSVLATGPNVRGLNPAEDNGF
jgi:hypothetical protein